MILIDNKTVLSYYNYVDRLSGRNAGHDNRLSTLIFVDNSYVGGFILKKLTQERLKDFLDYDPLTGLFTNIITRSSRSIKGDIPGYKNPKGYIYIRVDKQRYLAHRLAFLFMVGYFPENEVDHKNRIRDDNRWANLREVTRQCNMRNTNVQKKSTTMVSGVILNKKSKTWRARIGVGGKDIYLGYFKSKADAAKARWKAEKKYNFPNCCTTSSAYNYLRTNDLII